MERYPTAKEEIMAKKSIKGTPRKAVPIGGGKRGFEAGKVVPGLPAKPRKRPKK